PFCLLSPLPPVLTPFPYTTLFRSRRLRPNVGGGAGGGAARLGDDAGGDRAAHSRGARGHGDGRRGAQGRHAGPARQAAAVRAPRDRKSTRLNSSHLGISYAVFCLK